MQIAIHWHPIMLWALLTLSSIASAAPSAKLLPGWDAHNASNTQSINHEAWADFLSSYAVKESQHTLIDYKSAQSDRAALDTYIEQLSKINPLTHNRNEQMAYWINLYNALTVQLILNKYPVSSITELGGIFSFGPWDKHIIRINNTDLSLNDIEHRILRPIWKDARIHYAVNCASLGCPNLALTPYRAKRLDEQLDQAAKAFINSPKGIHIEGNKIKLSRIYEWYAQDFGSEHSLFAHLKAYHQDPTLLEQLSASTVIYDYDWRLNSK